jgi:hypothetical protein
MKKIPLTQGMFCIVDDADFKYLSSFKWHVKRIPKPYAYNSAGKSMARLIMGANKGMVIDHIDGDTLDNRRKNLRECLQSVNITNRGKQKNHSGKYKGVYCLRNKYFFARIYRNKKSIHLGFFRNQEDASEAYKKAVDLYDRV